MRRIRWSGEGDRYFGPLTYSRDRNYRPIAVMLGSGDAEDGDPQCRLRVSGFGHTLIVALPSILKPHRVKVKASSWGKETVERLGRDWYYAYTEREYGFNYSDGHLSVHYGRSSHDSSTEQRWGWFVPWREWRFVRHSYYDLDGNLFWTQTDERDFRAASDAKDRCPSIIFPFDDYDGERIEAETIIEEREWKLGTRKFKWLSWFRKPRVSRSLDIRFSKETGRRKGSWKGGTIGHSIAMLPGELHESAFRRYCAEHDMTFVEPIKLWLRTPNFNA